MNRRIAHFGWLLLFVVRPFTAVASDNLDDEVLFRFLFPNAHIQVSSIGATINDSGHVIRAERRHRGWRIFLPDRRSWEARRFGDDGWRVINDQGRSIELRPSGGALLAGANFEGRWHQVRQIGSQLEVDAGTDAYFDFLHRRQQTRSNEVKGLPTRSRLLQWRRE